MTSAENWKAARAAEEEAKKERAAAERIVVVQGRARPSRLEQQKQNGNKGPQNPLVEK